MWAYVALSHGRIAKYIKRLHRPTYRFQIQGEKNVDSHVNVVLALGRNRG